MKDNIFEGAKFGDKYITKNGKIVFYLHKLDDDSISCLVGDEKQYGFSILESEDIASKYQEAIDEEKLDKLAHNHCMNSGYSGIDDDDYINDETLTWGDIMKDIERAYKVGYKKAMEYERK